MSSEPRDDLLDALGAVQREEDEAYPHDVEAWLRGQLDREALFEARPTEAERQELRALLELLGDDANAGAPDPTRAAETWADRIGAELRPAAASSSGPVPIERARWRRSALVSVASLAAAASLVLVLRPTDHTDERSDSADRRHTEDPASYVLVVRDTPISATRSTPDPNSRRIETVAHYSADSTIRWLVTPRKRASSAAALAIVARRGDEVRVIAPTSVARSEHGVLEVRGRLGQLLGLSEGRWTLRFAVGPDDAPIPAQAAELRADRGWHFVDDTYVIELVPAAG